MVGAGILPSHGRIEGRGSCLTFESLPSRLSMCSENDSDSKTSKASVMVDSEEKEESEEEAEE